MEFFTRKHRSRQLEETEQKLAEIRKPADEALKKASEKAESLNKLLAEVRGSNDFTIKFYLATNGRKR